MKGTNIITLAVALMLATELLAVNINVASADELVILKGIGPKLAERIITYRMASEFETIEEIKNVKGIGEKKFEVIERDLDV